MKYMFASDIHGSAAAARRISEIYKKSGAKKLILLGDLLYHGPRNALPEEYDTQSVAGILNELKDDIAAVRGNCDAEVDQLVLNFPMRADYAVMELNGIEFYVTHGHLASPDALPPMKEGQAFISGHTHIPVLEKKDGIWLINPGSTSIPHGGFKASYAVLDEKHFTIYDLDGEVIMEAELV